MDWFCLENLCLDAVYNTRLSQEDRLAQALQAHLSLQKTRTWLYATDINFTDFFVVRSRRNGALNAARTQCFLSSFYTNFKK